MSSLFPDSVGENNKKRAAFVRAVAEGGSSSPEDDAKTTRQRRKMKIESVRTEGTQGGKVATYLTTR